MYIKYKALYGCALVALCLTGCGSSTTSSYDDGRRQLKDEEEYEGYLFCHFTGTEGDHNCEQIYFALAEDGFNFVDMNNKKPVLVSEIGETGVRDPFIYRSPVEDKFYILATDLSINARGGWGSQRGQNASKDGSGKLVIWESEDLVDWGEPKLVQVAPEIAGMAWAPEMIYDEENDQYVIIFSSSLLNPAVPGQQRTLAKPDAIYYVTTYDFTDFSEPNLFIDNQIDYDPGKQDRGVRKIIDATCMKIGDYYYAACKDGDNNEDGGIRVFRSETLYDPESWEKVFDLDELGFVPSQLGIPSLTNSSLEGPELFMFNQKDWADPDVPEYGLMGDQYMGGDGYLPFKTTDIEDATNANGSWSSMKKGVDYSFDSLKKRHGSVLNLTAEEIERIKEAYPNT